MEHAVFFFDIQKKWRIIPWSSDALIEQYSRSHKEPIELYEPIAQETPLYN